MTRLSFWQLCISLFFCFNSFSFAATLTPSGCTETSGKKSVYGAECGSIALAEDPQDIRSDKIDVYLMRIPAIRETDKPPIFFIAGGPGQASTDLATSFRQQFANLLIEHDFIFMDQRGTGKSNPLNCDFDTFAYAALPPSEVEAKSLEALQTCIAGYKADLAQYSTPQAIFDLDNIRQVLGYTKIILWGGSYGSRVALSYAREFPETSAGIILDGVAPVHIMLPFHAQQDSSASLAKVFDSCSADRECEKSFPNLRSSWLKLLNRLTKESQTVLLKHPRTEKIHQVFIDHEVVSGWARMTLYSREVIAVLPLALYKATQGDFSTLYSIYALAFENISDGVSEGMQLAVLCTEDYQLSLRQQSTQETYDRTLFMPPPDDIAKSCAYFPKGNVASSYFEQEKLDVPTLMLSGNYDPATPPRWAQTLEPFLSHYKHIVAPGGHHIISSLGCMPDVISNFVKNPMAVKDIDSKCANNITSPRFFIDGAGPSLISHNLEPAL